MTPPRGHARREATSGGRGTFGEGVRETRRAGSRPTDADENEGVLPAGSDGREGAARALPRPWEGEAP